MNGMEHVFIRGTGIEIDVDNLLPEEHPRGMILLECTRLDDDNFVQLGFGC